MLLCGGVTAIAIGNAATTNMETPSVNSGTQPVRSEPEPHPDTFVPNADNFILDIRTTEKQCFGTAGCNVQFRVELGYDGPSLDPAVTYEVTYAVTGGDGELISTLTVNGDQYSASDQFVSTSSEDAELKALVTDVSVR